MRENSATPAEVSTGPDKNLPSDVLPSREEKGCILTATLLTSHFADASKMVGKGAFSDPTPVPAGAQVNEWTPSGVRDVYRILGTVQTASSDPLHWPVVAVAAEQRRDGRLGVVDVDVDARTGLNATQARELAALLMAAADLAEEWVR